MTRSNIEGGRLYPGTYIDNDHMGDWSVMIGTGSSLVDSALPGGIVDLVAGTNEGGAVQLVGPRAFEVDVGVPLEFEIDVNPSVDGSDLAAIFMGWTDANVAVEIPIEDEDGTLETAATDAVGLMLEREQDATWQSTSVINGVDGAQTPLTAASDLVVGTWQRLRVVIGVSATADFYIGDYDGNNNFLGWSGGGSLETRSAAITSSVRLCPIISIDGRAAAFTLQVRNPMFRGPGLERS